MIVAILATGPSMSQAVADCVKGRCTVIAVSDAYRLAPWADVLVSQDRKWWLAHPEALQFAGRKLRGGAEWQRHEGTEHVKFEGAVTTSSNSGLLACMVAVQVGATRILLCGFDMGGTHFFGEHPAPLKNTPPERFEVFKQQFASFRPRGIEIINCTPGSALRCYRMGTIEDGLAQPPA